MVMELLNEFLNLTTVVFALSTAVCGILVLNSLFKDKLQELFDDKTFFIFFLLVTGYILFALGELTWYLTFKLLSEVPSPSMPDFYWVSGSLILVFAFGTLSTLYHHQNRDINKIGFTLGLGVVLVGLVIFYLTSIDLTQLAKTQGQVFIGFFYPIASSLLVVFSATILFYLHHLKHFRTSLILFFCANLGIFIGDLLYVSTTVVGNGGVLELISGLIYTLAYLASTFSFLIVLLKDHGLAEEDIIE